MKKKLVIIGNGMAAMAALEELLKLDACIDYDIMVFGAESHHNYNRVLLSQVLSGEKPSEDITIHDDTWYKENGIELKSGVKVSAIDRVKRAVITEGEVFHYDKLVIATGSTAFMPPIDGADKDGVFTFRTLNDCERIREAVSEGGKEERRKVAVIGGGLLGLEAAHAISRLGAEVTVVHLADMLMELQLDATSAELLLDDLQAMGINVLLNKETVSIEGGESVSALKFKDGSTLEVDTIIVSVGIRPNIELASKSGVYCERGIVVSDTMQSYDPAIYAIGECVEHRGRTFGLVGPIFDQARVLADHLSGTARLVFADKPTSARLKVPGIDLYSAGRVFDGKDSNEEVETIEFLDRSSKIYKRLFVRDNRIEGIVIFGDTTDGARLFGYLQEGRDISDMRSTILFGEGVKSGGFNIDTMTDDTIVCGCNGVTKKMIVDAVETKGLFTRADVCKETRASSSCGGCGDLIDVLLESVLGSNFESATASGICECTKYTREDIIKNIQERRLLSVGEVLETLGWETVGCEECRPAINYYVSMVWPLEAVDDRSSRLVNEREHANIQADDTFSVVPRMYGGVTTPDELRRIAKAADDYSVPLVKITGGQRIDLIGVKREDLSDVWKALDMPSGFAYAKALRTVKSCVGKLHCRYGTQDSLTLAVELEKYFEGLWMPAKVKLSVSGCPRNCSESGIKDVGIVGVKGGYEILVGGSGGIESKGAKPLIIVETVEEVLDITAAFLQYYRESADYGERTYKWVRRVGLDRIKKSIIEDDIRRAELSARMTEALSVTYDPWKEKIV